MLNLRIKAACALGLCVSLCAAGFAASLDERISEQKKQLAFTKITIAVALGLAEMEKEHSENNQSALHS